MDSIKNFLIKALGGYTKEDFNKKTHQDGCDEYKEAIESLYFYVGSYPAWKAQQEYRELMFNMGLPVKHTSSPTHVENIDQYLGKVVNVINHLVHKNMIKCGDVDNFWKEGLSEARGDEYLVNQQPQPSSKGNLYVLRK
jgi:hypothetical protein